jgi:hypothetical protein
VRILVQCMGEFGGFSGVPAILLNRQFWRFSPLRQTGKSKAEQSENSCASFASSNSLCR